MPNNVVHFAVHADNVERAKTFYEMVFRWQFESWGPEDFFLIHTGQPGEGIHGALQKRQHPVIGEGVRAFECTISVDDLSETVALIEANGGKVVFGPQEIPTVGRLVQFNDTEGNVVCAMQYFQGSTNGEAG